MNLVTPDQAHDLWLQACFETLTGLGQEEELTLRDPEEPYRIEKFIANLRKHKESVESLDLTLEELLKILVLPPQDEPIFIEMMKTDLGLNAPLTPG